MDLNESEDINKRSFKISCSNVPLELLGKTAARSHFRKFGRIIRIHLKPKSRICQIEYSSEESARRAIFEGNEYKGQVFNIIWGAEPSSKKKRPRKDPDPDWQPDDPDWQPDDPEVQAELDAMAGRSSAKRAFVLRSEGTGPFLSQRRGGTLTFRSRPI